MQSGDKLWIRDMGGNVERFLHSLMGQLPASGGGLGLTEDSEKTRQVCAHIPMKVREPATRRLYCVLRATSPDENRGQLGTAPRDHLPITKSDVEVERF